MTSDRTGGRTGGDATGEGTTGEGTTVDDTTGDATTSDGTTGDSTAGTRRAGTAVDDAAVGEAAVSDAVDEAAERRSVLATAAFGALMLVAAVLVIVDAVRLPETSEAVGPAAVPLPVGVLLGVVGAALLVRARRQLPTAVRGQAWQAGAGARLLGMVVALVGFALLLPLLGYVVTSAALFVAAALLLGAPRSWRTAAYGWALAAIVFLVFDRLIGLSLPAGPWGF
jgi:putative tricarboxylic transport membrane protein